MRYLIFILVIDVFCGVVSRADTYAEQAEKLSKIGAAYSASRGASSTALAASFMMQQNAFKASQDAAKKREEDQKKGDSQKTPTPSAAQSVPQPQQAPAFVAPTNAAPSNADQIADISKILQEASAQTKASTPSVSDITSSGKEESEKSLIEKLADERIKAIEQQEVSTLTNFVKQSQNLGLAIAGLSSPNTNKEEKPQSRLLKTLQEKTNAATNPQTTAAPTGEVANVTQPVNTPQPHTSGSHSPSGNGSLTVNQIH